MKKIIDLKETIAKKKEQEAINFLRPYYAGTDFEKEAILQIKNAYKNQKEYRSN